MSPSLLSSAEARDVLCARWPGRREQISQLLGYLGEPHDHAAPVFVHGPPVTGKTSIVRDAFVTLGRPFAYTSLVDSHGPRLLLDALAEELEPHLVARDPAAAPPRCDRLADLITLLHDGLPPDGPAVYLVIDEATRLLDWKGADAFLPALTKLSELTRRNVAAVFVATPGWDAFRSAAGVRPPQPLFFDSYTKAQLQTILIRERPLGADEKLYQNFVAAILPMYAATCKSLHELRALFAPLWSRYAAPWVAARDARTRAEERGDDPATIPSLPEPRQLFAALQSGEPSEKPSTKTASVVSGADPAVPPSAEGKEAASGEEAASENAASGVGGTLKRKKAWTGPVLHAGLTVPLSPAALALDRGHVWPVPEDDVAGGAGGKLDFDIPRLTKFMLVSAHLATMNRESVDRRLFGHMVEGVTPGTSAIAGGPKKRSRGAMGADKQQEAAAEAAAEGPGAFHLERLLAYFRIVTKQAYDEDDAGSEELARELLSADVFMQISSMVALGLLTRVSGADALDSVRYRCDIGDDLARKIAANLRVNLDNYLFYT